MTPTLELAPRFRVASHWWMATEILRRNPHLHLAETYPLDGFYDCLTLRGEVESRPVHIDFNRLGSVHVHPDHIGLLNDWAALTHNDAHHAVKEIERAAGLAPTEAAPTSNSRAITLRLIARVLNYLVNDKSSWDARMLGEPLFNLPSPYAPTLVDETTSAHPFATIFPTADQLDAFAQSAHTQHGVEPGRLWVLLRSESPVAIFDAKGGVVHTREARVALRPLYARMNRNLTQTMAHALGGLLP